MDEPMDAPRAEPIADPVADAPPCPARRRFLRQAATLTAFVAGVDPSLRGAFAATGLTRDRRRGTAGGKTLVYVFQRFGCDGLNLIVPTDPSEHALYRSYRPTLGVDRNRPDLGRLDASFSLSPWARDGLLPLFQAGHLAVLPNVGYADNSRSHFDSQAYLDNGTPFVKTTADGWLNRHLQSAPSPGDPLRALCIGRDLSAALMGPASALVFTDVKALAVAPDPGRNDRFLSLAEEVHRQPSPGRPYDGEAAAAGLTLIEGIRSIPSLLPAPTVPYPKGTFAAALMQLSQLLRLGRFDIEVAVIDFPGWDHHANQDRADLFPAMVAELAGGLKAFVDDLGPLFANVLVVTASEFGRTARENGSGGTDHGSAWASLVLGERVRGGVHLGPRGWHGLADLREDRDLKYSVDYRDLFAEVLAAHLGGDPAAVFPGFTRTPIGLF